MGDEHVGDARVGGQQLDRVEELAAAVVMPVGRRRDQRHLAHAEGGVELHRRPVRCRARARCHPAGRWSWRGRSSSACRRRRRRRRSPRRCARWRPALLLRRAAPGAERRGRRRRHGRAGRRARADRCCRPRPRARAGRLRRRRGSARAPRPPTARRAPPPCGSRSADTGITAPAATTISSARPPSSDTPYIRSRIVRQWWPRPAEATVAGTAGRIRLDDDRRAVIEHAGRSRGRASPAVAPSRRDGGRIPQMPHAVTRTRMKSPARAPTSSPSGPSSAGRSISTVSMTPGPVARTARIPGG